MSLQITIEDLRYIVAQQYKSKDTSDKSYLNLLLRYINNIRSLSGKDYYNYMYNTGEETMRSSGIPKRKSMNRDDMLYYDTTNKFRSL